MTSEPASGPASGPGSGPASGAGSTDHVRTVVVGAGPGALSVVLALQCRGIDAEPLVIDPSGVWLERWRRRFAAQDIPHLRSPAVHHPHPDAFALLARADDEDLVRSSGVHLPSTALFDRFIDELVEDHALAGLVHRDRVTRIDVDASGAPTVTTGQGAVVRAEHVIVATDRRVAARVAVDPDLAVGRVVGLDGADVASVTAGERIAVIGGGLSATHLALGAARRGAQVVLIARRNLEVRRFDTHPSWLGPARRREFESLPDAAARRRAIAHARGGGTVPHRTLRELMEFTVPGDAPDGASDDDRRDAPAEVSGGGVRIERAELVGCHAASGQDSDTAQDGVRLELRVRGSTPPPRLGLFDRVWLATGGSVDVASDPLCTSLIEGAPAVLAGGLPELDADLCWPGTRVHLLGACAGLVLGPVAGNLVGLRRGAQRIAAGLAGEDPARADRAVTGSGACVVRTPARRTRSERRAAGRPSRPPRPSHAAAAGTTDR